MHSVESLEMLTRSAQPATLCGRCKGLELWRPHYRFRDIPSELERLSASCDFCRMRWDLCKHLDPREFPFIQFDRLESMLRMNESYPPVLSLARPPGKLQLPNDK